MNVMQAMLSFAGRYGPVILFVGVFVGLLLPPLAGAARPLMGVGVFIFTLGAFLKVGAGVPLVTWALLDFLPLPAGTKTGMLAPPVGSAAAMAVMLRLNPALALVATVVISLLAPLLLPPAALTLGAIDLHVDGAALTLRLAQLVMGAAALSAGLRRFAPGVVRNAAQAMTGVSVLGLLLVATGVMHGLQPQVLRHGPEVLSALLVAFGLNLGFQLLGSLLFARLGWRDAVTVGLVSGNRNVTLIWVAAAPWLGHSPGVELYLAAGVFPIFMLPLPLSRLLSWWENCQQRGPKSCLTDA